MEFTPNARSSRFAQLDPGDLFIVRDDTGSYVALAVKDPNSVKNPNATDKMVLLLGPASPTVPHVPALTNLPQQTPVVSFGKDYKVRLPCNATAWLSTEPPVEDQCVVLADDKLCIRARFGNGVRLSRCYVSVEDGILLLDGAGRFAGPGVDCAYTLDWAFLTNERHAREIISSPRIL
jgi:hypothetical protein